MSNNSLFYIPMFLILETTVLDEVLLDVPLDDVPDVPQLPALLDVQNAAIILEDVPDYPCGTIF